MFQGVILLKIRLFGSFSYLFVVYYIYYVINILPFGEAWWGLYLVGPLFS